MKRCIKEHLKGLRGGRGAWRGCVKSEGRVAWSTCVKNEGRGAWSGCVS